MCLTRRVVASGTIRRLVFNVLAGDTNRTKYGGVECACAESLSHQLVIFEVTTSATNVEICGRNCQVVVCARESNSPGALFVSIRFRQQNVSRNAHLNQFLHDLSFVVFSDACVAVHGWETRVKFPVNVQHAAGGILNSVGKTPLL